MIPIIDFSWREFKLFQQSLDVSVQEFYGLAHSHNPNLFLLHDPDRRLSALVIPDLVIQTVERFDLPFEAPVVATGLPDLLRQGQMTVHVGLPASLVTLLAGAHEIESVVVADDSAFPIGLFIPSVVAERLPETYRIQGESSETLQRTVRRLTATGNLAGAIAAIEGAYDDFHSERLNQIGADPYVCDGNGKPHYWRRCPCKWHPSASCGRRTISRA
ncbi:MAG TPA: hypothetical protein DEP84_03520 [Chloroflexi bacterium]|nr:hypothetical protein [Chloroflexota bacterium]